MQIPKDAYTQIGVKIIGVYQRGSKYFSHGEILGLLVLNDGRAVFLEKKNKLGFHAINDPVKSKSFIGDDGGKRLTENFIPVKRYLVDMYKCSREDAEKIAQAFKTGCKITNLWVHSMNTRQYTYSTNDGWTTE